jgi:predicted MFS family arabinose efflux permease
MSGALIAIFMIATGQAVASNYLAQPLLEEIRRELHLTTEVAGLIVTTAQIGYAAGLVLLLPLGDLLERRRLITTLAAMTALGLAGAGFAPSIGVFLGAAGLIGFTSVMAQLLVPFAASLSPEAERGRVVGMVMSGLLLGILLARTAAGFIAQIGGWRTVYWVAAALMLVQMIVLRSKLPTYRERVALGYPRLLASVLEIARAEPVLRWRAVYGALSFAGFSVLWTTLAFLLSRPPYGFGQATIGLFGLIGAAGAATATLAGRFSDRGWKDTVTGLASLLLLLAFVIMWPGSTSLAALIVGIIVLDVGAQAVHITNQG